ncbi:hypothetical protein L7F22_035265 [Adiantum nelumboides]|nr:hypothetical protein [Adiantum nelumboides]
MDLTKAKMWHSEMVPSGVEGQVDGDYAALGSRGSDCYRGTCGAISQNLLAWHYISVFLGFSQCAATTWFYETPSLFTPDIIQGCEAIDFVFEIVDRQTFIDPDYQSTEPSASCWSSGGSEVAECASVHKRIACGILYTGWTEGSTAIRLTKAKVAVIARAVLKNLAVLLLGGNINISSGISRVRKGCAIPIKRFDEGRTTIVVAYRPTTTIMVVHRLTTICNANTIAVVEEGCILELALQMLAAPRASWWVLCELAVACWVAPGQALMVPSSNN